MEEQDVQIPESKKLEERSLVEDQKVDRRKVELVLFFIIGLLFGVAVKIEAQKTITMGFGDYMVPKSDTVAYDLNAIQKTVAASGSGSSVGGAPQGGLCGQ